MTQDTTLIDQMLEDNPLTIFSLYTNVQAKFLVGYGSDIIRTLDKSFSTHPDGHTIVSGEDSDVWGPFWLWVLGAYEVVRVMAGSENCFSQPVVDHLGSVKKMLEQIRMPFAKQELQGTSKRRPGEKSKGKPIYGELSYYSISGDRKDYAFKIKGALVWMRPTIEEFQRFIRSIKRTDILSSLPICRDE